MKKLQLQVLIKLRKRNKSLSDRDIDWVSTVIGVVNARLDHCVGGIFDFDDSNLDSGRTNHRFGFDGGGGSWTAGILTRAMEWNRETKKKNREEKK